MSDFSRIVMLTQEEVDMIAAALIFGDSEHGAGMPTEETKALLYHFRACGFEVPDE